MSGSFLTRIGNGLTEWKIEWKARRDGRKHLTNDLHQATRDIVGPTGWVVSKSWDQLSNNRSAYVKSFDKNRIPPSLHVSERDRIRAGEVMPLTERCIEDYTDAGAVEPGPWKTEDLEPESNTKPEWLSRYRRSDSPHP